MTDKKELEALQDKARRAGRVANLIFDEGGTITSVFYLDPNGPGLQRSGLTLDPISFAEREREKLAWWQLPEKKSAK